MSCNVMHAEMLNDLNTSLEKIIRNSKPTETKPFSVNWLLTCFIFNFSENRKKNYDILSTPTMSLQHWNAIT